MKHSISSYAERPACPACTMRMITTVRAADGTRECTEFKCLRCGHIELSQPATLAVLAVA